MPAAAARTLTFISAFEVPPDADEAFAAAWDRIGSSAVLHRALRADVELRFVSIARDEPNIAPLPFPAHTAAYEAVHEDGEPDGSGGVVLIDPVDVPAGEDERFRDGWARMHEVFAPRQGYLGARLHRSPDPADFRFVSVVRWSSPLMVARTQQQPEYARAAAALPYRGRPALYLIAS